MKHLNFLLSITFLIYGNAYCQNKTSMQTIEKRADSLYKAKNFNLATKYYIESAENSDFTVKKSTAFYNAACCLSLQSKKDSAIIILKKAIKNGYSNKENVLKDSDLINIHTEKDWKEIISSIQKNEKSLNDNPRKVKFISSDVENFWIAYKTALKDTINRKKIFKKLYFDKATGGMNDYMGSKVSSIDKFITTTKLYPKFYASIDLKTKIIKKREQEFFSTFIKLKEIYSQAKFPDVYFVVGAFTSGGTVSNNGLLIGINQYYISKEVALNEFDFKLRSRLNNWSFLPNVIAHELIHFQQNGLKAEKTTLSYVIKEGMADFIGELISGATSNPDLHEWQREGKNQFGANLQQTCI